MNTTAIIASIIALLGGMMAGTAIEKSNPTENFNQNREAEMRNANETLAADYVAMRPGISDLPTETLSEAEIDGLILMREEEKLARDVYQTLYDTWGLQIFSNIAQSEQTHTEAVRDLMEKYGLTDPVIDDTIGVFQSDDLQNLYDTLVAQGSQSLTEALIVGATIEDLDINDLNNLLAETDNEDIKLVYDNLNRGSRNHLRSFMKQLDKNDGTYEPQFISETEFNDILTGDQEQGSGHGGSDGGGESKGGGRGWGKNR